MVDVGILGTGNLAVTLGSAWAAAGHAVAVTGRDRSHALDAAARIGAGARALTPDGFASGTGVVVVAVAWEGLVPALGLVGAGAGSLAGRTVIDCTNAVDVATGRLRPTSGSAAQAVADAAPGAHVVKGLHLFAGASWPYRGPADRAPVVAICGDRAGALDAASALIGDLGARTAVIGGLSSARQLEEVAGFVMRIVASGHNARHAVPDVDPALPPGARTGG